MAKDAIATMGTILTDDVGGRDAVHVAVISAEAAGKLTPGQHVGRKPVSTADHLIVGTSDDPIGIVDPFLETTVSTGQRFWLYLYPRTITSLRHNWTHPAFQDVAPEGAIYNPPSQKVASEQWLREFCKVSDCPGYEELMAAAAKVADGRNDSWDGEYLHFNGSDAHGDIPPEFWQHVEIVLGREIKGKRPTYFSCSC